MGKEKKEIWKLLELLNEYEKWESWISNARTTNLAFLYYLNNPAPISELNLISKKFWFIKWLVENDKIDTSKANDKNLNGYEIELRIRAVKELVADSEEKTVLYLKLLMLLSISSSPIEDLISYLK